MTNRQLPSFRMKAAQALLGVGLLGIIIEFFTNEHWLLPPCVAMAIGGALLGLNRLVCRKCGLKHTSICADISCCHACGTNYYESHAAVDRPA